MPVLRQVRERFERERPLEGLRVGACLHVTAETAILARTLVAGGAEVALCASNPLSTQDEVAALVDRHGVEVFAIQGENPETYYRHIEAVCDKRPQVTLDDGADLISVLHGNRTDQLPDILGGTENTTTGVLRVRALQAQGKLAFPVVAVNEAATNRLLDNVHGTGQSALDGILRATNVLLAGRRLVVIGFGACGRGVALRAKGAGAKVIVCEVDPLRALEAAMEGYEVMPAAEAAAVGDVFVTVTGNRHVLGTEHFAAMGDGAIVCNAGHFDVEIDKPALAALSESTRTVRPNVRGAHARGRPPHQPAGGRPRGEPRRRRGPSRRGDGHGLLRPRAVGGAHRPLGGLAREARAPAARGDRRRDRTSEAGIPRHADRRADGRAAAVSAFVGAGHVGMAQAHVEALREIYEDWARGEWGQAYAVYSEDFEWGWSPEFPDIAGVYRDVETPNCAPAHLAQSLGALVLRGGGVPRERGHRGGARPLSRAGQGKRRGGGRARRPCVADARR